MEKLVHSWEKSNIFNLYLIQFIFITGTILAQGPTSTVGDRENLGLFGGPADDLSISLNNHRIFAAVHSPATLLFSDDSATSWHAAFAFDSLEYDFETRGWGGGAHKVLTNQSNWVAVHTGFSQTQLSASVVSYDNGNSFQTAIDPHLMNVLVGEQKRITAIGLSNHYLYTAMENYLIRQNDTSTFNSNILVVNLDTVQSLLPDAVISSIAVSDHFSGFPIYFTVNEMSGDNRLFKYDGIFMNEIFLPFLDKNVINVYTHPGQPFGDIVVVSTRDIFTQEVFIYRSLSGGLSWFDITPFSVPQEVISDADYSPFWAGIMPNSNGLRLSFPDGMISDDLGDSWFQPGPGLQAFGISTHPDNVDLIFGSNNIGIVTSISGINGPFIPNENIGFTSVSVNEIVESQGIYYVATDAGLAYTKEYFNPLVNNYELWQAPNGIFPVPNVGDEFGVTAVAIDPFDSLHVICGNANGFNVTFSGPGSFTDITPLDWNNNAHYDAFVTDIVFVSPNVVIATSGLKFKELNEPPPLPIGNIWRSDDGGISWGIASPPFPVYTMGNCLEVHNGAQQIIYSGTGFKNNGLLFEPGALWASYDTGLTWIYLSDGPVFGASQSLPIYDIEIDPFNPDNLYLSAANVFAHYESANGTYYFTDIPYNTGLFTSAMIDPLFPDTIVVYAGRNVYKYNSFMDDADLKFKGMPGEVIRSSAFGSVLAGSGIGLSKITEASTYMLNLRVYIEGPYNGIDMNTSLNTDGYLPLTQPFNQPPWNYNGTESVVAIPSADIVDWVLIDLRKTQGDSSTATAKTRFDRQAAFLLKDGTIVDDDGFSDPRFSFILEGVKGSDKVTGVVYAPSHIGERSGTEMSSSKSTSTFSYDFTTDPNQVYGGASAHKELSPGVWGMISGDGNQDGKVNNVDKNEVWLPQFGNSGYYSGDFNRDGTVNNIDKDDFWEPNVGKGDGTK